MNPDDAIPGRQLWSRAAEGGLRPAEFGTYTTPLIRKTDTVAAVGTLLAARLMGALRGNKFPVIRAEPPHPAFADIPPEAEEYRSFSASYGEVWSARALRQLIRRSDRSFMPKEDRWQDGDNVIDPFRPGLLYPARTDQEFDLLLGRHLNAVRSAFRRCSTLLVALGGSEICEAIGDGAVIPAWSEASAGNLDSERHAFRMLSVAETIADLNDAIDGLRALNPGMKIILMISPERQAATATPTHVIAADTLGKAILRVAMEEVAIRPGVSYFPALEIAGLLGANAFGPDGRSLGSKSINLVTAALIEACEGGSIEMTVPERAAPAAAETETSTEEIAGEAPPAPAPEPPPTQRVMATVVDPSIAAAPAPRGKRRKQPTQVSHSDEALPETAPPPPATVDGAASDKEKLREERSKRREAREAKQAIRRREKTKPIEPSSTAEDGAIAGATDKPRRTERSTEAGAPKRGRVAKEPRPPRSAEGRVEPKPVEGGSGAASPVADRPKRARQAEAGGESAAPRRTPRRTKSAASDGANDVPGPTADRRVRRKAGAKPAEGTA